MVQFISSQPSGISRFLQKADPGISSLTDRLLERKRLGKEDAALKEMDIDTKGITTPKLREAFLEQNIKQKNALSDVKADQERTQVIGKYFGDQAAEVYPHLTEGGKTKFFEALLEGKMRGDDTNKILGNFIMENPDDITPQIQPSTSDIGLQASPNKQDKTSNITPGTEKSRQPVSAIEPEKESEFQFPEIQPPKKTPKELSKYKMAIRKDNVELFREARNKSKSLKNQEDHLNILDKLSEEVPDISRFMVNTHGQLRPLAQMIGLVPPKAERFIKTVNDFITEAKDIFGSRVTNFDLQTFQSRLPSLLNSKEGRKQIIEQMKIFSEIERNYNDALNKVYKHYGLEGISEEQASEIAEQMISGKEAKLRERLNAIGIPQYDLQELPDPSQSQGKIIENDQGKRFRSTGTSWEPI